MAAAVLAAGCGAGGGSTGEAGACGDGRGPTVEVCNGVDDDCDGVVDGPDALGAAAWWPDADRDGFGDAAGGVRACAPPEGWVAVGGDCDDGDAAVRPGAIEVCNGADDDCDGRVDEADAADAPDWYDDDDGDGYGVGVPVRSCGRPPGHALLPGDCDDGDEAVYPGAIEVCNGRDDDCDGRADEADAADAPDWWPDADGDGYGAGDPVRACGRPPDHAPVPGDCDDDRGDVNPAADEVCGGGDEDCDGLVDVGAVDAGPRYRDLDGDGHGDAALPVIACPDAPWTAPAAGDCDDREAAVFPGADEVCNGVDDDCDGAVDEGVSLRFYVDVDGDGYGVDALPVDACARPEGTAPVGGDCHDQDAAISPEAREVCNGVDDDCDGAVDDADPDRDPSTGTAWRWDGDGDGFGAGEAVQACGPPPGYVSGPVDCNDADPAIDPASACDWRAGFVLPGPATLFLVPEDDATVAVACGREETAVPIAAGGVGVLAAGPGACTVRSPARTVVQVVSAGPGGDRLSIGRSHDGSFGGTELFVWADGPLLLPGGVAHPTFSRWTGAGWVEAHPAAPGGPALWRVRADVPVTAIGWRLESAERHFAWIPSDEGLLVGEAFSWGVPPVVQGAPALVVHCVDAQGCSVTERIAGGASVLLADLAPGGVAVRPVAAGERLALTSAGAVTVRAEATPRGFGTVDGAAGDTALVPGLGGGDVDTAFHFVAALGETTLPDLTARRTDVWVIGYVDATDVAVTDLSGAGGGTGTTWRVDAGEALRVAVDADPGTAFRVEASAPVSVQLVHAEAPFSLSLHTGFFRDR